MNTRIDAEGNKVLFLEEIQSDWGQKGKKEGFKTEEKQKEWDTLEKNRQELWAKDNAIRDEIAKEPNKEKRLDMAFDKKAELEAIQKEVNDVVKKQQALFEGLQTPSAPFVTDTNAWTKRRRQPMMSIKWLSL